MELLSNDSRFVRDHFNGNHILGINSVVGHDMWIETYDVAGMQFGSAYRVYNWAGSGATGSVCLYEYLLALHKNYGQREYSGLQLDFNMAALRENDICQTVIRDLPDEPHFMKLISGEKFFSFQTFTEMEDYKSYGPVVHIDKSLPAARKEARALTNYMQAHNRVLEMAV